jgi:pyruvate dehydrogenase E2 component (dihydrolipoamide acetyltransferase)
VAEGRLRKFGETEVKPLSRIKKISGEPGPQLGDDPARHLVRRGRHHRPGSLPRALNKENEKAGKLTMLAFLIKAGAAALKKFPSSTPRSMATTWSEEVLQHRLRGRHAERPGRAGDQGRRQEGRVADRAGNRRTGQAGPRRQAGPADMSGGCFTISSLGGIGGTYFTPIVNAPEVAILGVSKSSIQPVWDGKLRAEA